MPKLYSVASLEGNYLSLAINSEVLAIKFNMKYLPRPHKWSQKIKRNIRDKAIARAETRILIAGRKPQDFSETELEVIVREEEDKIKTNVKEKGLLAAAALLGLGWWI